MRMVHYYLALAVVAPLLLLGTAVTGLFHDGSQRHLALGLFTAIFCVALNTLLILFMIVTGRVLKQAEETRDLPADFLRELNEFFARKSAYPLAVLAAFSVVAAAVLGHGRFIGVPTVVHWLVGLAAVGLNLWAIQDGLRALRGNQTLLDRVAVVLDRQDAERLAAGAPEPVSAEPEWAFNRAKRWLIFAVCAWLPYFYWALVEWRGDFGRVAPLFLFGTALVSLLGLVQAWRTRTNAAGG